MILCGHRKGRLIGMFPHGCCPAQDCVLGRETVTLTGKIVFSLMTNKVRKYNESRWSDLRSAAVPAQRGGRRAEGQERPVDASPPQAGHSLTWQLGLGAGPHVYAETAAVLGKAPVFPRFLNIFRTNIQTHRAQRRDWSI